MERILAAVDLSANATTVVARAAELARLVAGRVRLVHVETAEAPPAEQLDASRFDDLLPPSRRDGIVIGYGDVANVVMAVAKDYEADLVVIGAHSYRWTERVLGTTAAKIVNEIDRPVLVVRPEPLVRTSIFPLATELRAQHRRLDRSYCALLDAYREGEWGDVHAEWDCFEPMLRAHIAHEEATCLVAFRAVDPRETDALLAEHVELRRLLDDVGLGIELHTAMLDSAEELVAKLRAHARREERSLYPWLEALQDRRMPAPSRPASNSVVSRERHGLSS